VTQQIDRINVLMTHVNEQIGRHVRVVWVVGASGSPPTSIDLSGEQIVYINLQAGGTPPTVEPLVANLDLTGAIAEIQLLMAQVEDKLPELKATAGKFLANQSGDTVKELRKPAEDRLASVLPNYEDALIRVQQMAISAGVLYQLWNVGTGTGTREAADRAYRDGLLDHSFKDRPVLPVDDTAQRTAFLTQLKGLQDAGLSFAAAARELGRSDDWISKAQGVVNATKL
jgi:hypothetical protein